MTVAATARTRAFTDLHSHLVPGVDDGARTIEDVLDGVERMVKLGVRTILTTPHISGSLTHDRVGLESRLGEVDRAFAEARERVAERFPKVTFLRGHEVMLDHPEPDLSDDRLRMAGGPWVLVEWPRLQIPPETPRVLRGLGERGWQVLIAHPERYLGYDAAMRAAEGWRDAGAHLQVNYGSIVGRYGPEVRERALYLLSRGLVACLASDFHGRPDLKIHMREARDDFEGAEALEEWKLLTAVNPGRIVSGADPLPVSSVSLSKSLLDRLLGVFRR